MPLYYGVARKGATDEEIADAARTVIQLLLKYGFKSDWQDGDVEARILVRLDAYKPDIRNEDKCYDDCFDVRKIQPIT